MGDDAFRAARPAERDCAGAGKRLCQYELVTDDELIEELFVPVYRPVATLIFLPAQAHRPSSIEMANVDPVDLAAAHARDRATLSAVAPAAQQRAP